MAAISRDEFIAMMTAELKRQEKETGNLANLPVLSAAEVLRKLYFDFPIVSEDEINSLLSALGKMEKPGAFDWDATPIRLSEKFLDNLVYLTGSKQASDSPAFAAAVGKLCTCVYLKLPARLLESDVATLRKVFMLPNDSAEREGVDGLAGEGESEGDGEGELLSWFEISQRFGWFIKKASASAICPAKAASAKAGREADWFVFSVRSESCVAHVRLLLSQLGQLRQLFEVEPSRGASGSAARSEVTVHKKFFERCYVASAAASRTTLLQSLSEQATRAATIASAKKTPPVAGEGAPSATLDASAAVSAKRAQQLEALDAIVRDIWMHCLFLARDIIAATPAIVDCWMPLLLSAIDSLGRSEGSDKGVPADFPDCADCLRVLLCANISSSLTPQLLQPTSETDAGQALTRNAQAGARQMLRDILGSPGSSSMSSLVEICRRMSSGSLDGGVEAAVFLLDIAELFLDANGLHVSVSHTQLTRQLAQSHERLVETRALAVTMELFEAALGPNAKPALRTAVPRLLDFLSVAALQSPATASFILRLPSTLAVLRHNMSLLCAVTSDEAAAAGTSATAQQQPPPPASFVPLLLGLLWAKDARADIISEMESMLGVLASLTIAKVAAAIEAQHASAVADDDEANEALDPSGATQRRKAKAVPGLARCLQLLTASQTGGIAALKALASAQPARATCTSIREIAMESTKFTGGDVKRLAKSVLSVLDGHGGSKVD